MSFEDLKDHDIFLPEKHWGKLDLDSSVNQPLLLGILILGVVSSVLMAIGGGNLLTWIGAILFLVFLILFTLISNTGIDNQNDLVDDVIREELEEQKSARVKSEDKTTSDS